MMRNRFTHYALIKTTLLILGILAARAVPVWGGEDPRDSQTSTSSAGVPAAATAQDIKPPLPKWTALYLQDPATPDMVAATIRNDTAKVLELVSHRRNVDERTREKQTALMFAAGLDHADMVKLLLDKGAKIEARDDRGESALSHAAMKGKKASLVVLLERGADTSVADTLSFTPLMLAAALDHTGVVEALLAAGAAIDARDRDGLTALIFAVQSKSLATVKLLLERGAKPNLVSSAQLTALDYAQLSGFADTVAFLSVHGGFSGKELPGKE